jgi:hypothetical protein
MRLRSPTFIRLERRVTRVQTTCAVCRYPRVELDPQYAPQVDGRDPGVTPGVFVFCSLRCAGVAVKGAVVVGYQTDVGDVIHG